MAPCYPSTEPVPWSSVRGLPALPPTPLIFPPRSSHSTPHNHGVFLLERGVGALGPARPSVLQPPSQQGCPGWVPDSTGAPPASGQTCADLGSLRAGMRDGFTASPQEGRNPHRSAPLSLPRGVTAAVTAAACLGGGSSGGELAYQIYNPPPAPASGAPHLAPALAQRRMGRGEAAKGRCGAGGSRGGMMAGHACGQSSPRACGEVAQASRASHVVGSRAPAAP